MLVGTPDPPAPNHPSSPSQQPHEVGTKVRSCFRGPDLSPESLDD